MSSKIDYRIVGDRGQTALHYALFEKDDAKVADLIKTWPVAKDIIKAYPSMELIRQPLPPLHYAAKHSNAECAKLLIAAGAPVDEFCDITKSTPLTEAARSGNAEVLAVLLAAGAVPTRRDATGRVPITHALCWSRENTTVALASLEDAEAAAKSIENKADNDLFTSLHNGIMFNSTCIAAFLKAAKATFQRTETA